MGKIEGMELGVAESGYGLVQKHLQQFGTHAENEVMLARLRQAMSEGRRVVGPDAAFFTHEAHEATLMARGVSYRVAHWRSIFRYEVSPYGLYHPEALEAAARAGSPFDAAYYRFWGAGQ